MNQRNNKPNETQVYGDRKPKGGWGKGKITLVTIISVLLLLCLGIGIYYLRLTSNPIDLFTSITTATQADSTTTETTTAQLMASATPAPTPTLNPYEQLQAEADESLMDGIVNILLIGVDYAQERDEWDGKKDWHSDVMMVAAVNFNENKVDLISIPRDTYAKIPGVEGKYKANASINCGGGFPDGFGKVCETCSWCLGGIPVDYYFAVTMPVVKELVNVIGGVNFDVDIDFTINGRSYTKGMQYMDGQAVLDYFRVRKNVAQAGDQNRINRQKKMLVALLKAAKNKDLIVKIPEIVQAFEGKLYTNMNLDQVASLALFGYSLPVEHIYAHSMSGATTDIFNWSFVLTDQQGRVDLIKEVYGLDVPTEKEYSQGYARYEWGVLQSNTYLTAASKLQAAFQKALEEDALLAPTPTPTPTPTITPTPTPTPDPDATPTPSPTPTPTPVDQRRFGQDTWDRYYRFLDEMADVSELARTYTMKEALKVSDKNLKETAKQLEAALDALKTDALALEKTIGTGTKVTWKTTLEYEIPVDFR